METKILDCTIRDGGYLNNWDFDEHLVRELYSAVSKSGTEYVEIGFRSSAKYVDLNNTGIWRITPEEKIDSIVKNNSGSKISLMVDYGKFDLTDIPNSSDSKVDLYRLAVHKNKILDAIPLVNSISEKGYEVALQLMGITKYTDDDFNLILEPIKNSKLTYLYFADSYGSLLPNKIKHYMDILRETGKKLGFHPHNNMQLGLANTLEAINLGIDIVDGTIAGMGRGAGNMQLETLLAYFQKSVSEEKYNVLPVLDLINRYFITLQKNYPWGYSLPYMISGVYEAHPNYAKILSENDFSIEDTRLALKIINQVNSVEFDKEIVSRISETGFIGDYDNFSIKKHSQTKQKIEIVNKPNYYNRHEGRNFLVLANGPSLIEYKNKIEEFIKKFNPIIVGANILNGLFIPDYHIFNNRNLFEKYANKISNKSTLLVPNSFDKNYVRNTTDIDFEHIEISNLSNDEFNINNGVINSDYEAVSVLSIAVSIAMGSSQVYIAGMDGYKDFKTFYELAFSEIQEDKENEMKNSFDISNRSGSFKEQMLWHNYVDKSLKKIQDYLIAKDLNDILIITPTSHKLYYSGISNYISNN